MLKTDMIKEAEEKLQQEKLEREKSQALSELRHVNDRVKAADDEVQRATKALKKAEEELEKEQKAASKYKETGDYEAYKEELGLNLGYNLTFSTGSGSSFGTLSPYGTFSLQNVPSYVNGGCSVYLTSR